MKRTGASPYSGSATPCNGVYKRKWRLCTPALRNPRQRLPPSALDGALGSMTVPGGVRVVRCDRRVRHAWLRLSLMALVMVPVSRLARRDQLGVVLLGHSRQFHNECDRCP